MSEMGPVIQPIDRSKWSMEWREPLGAWAVMVGGYDAGAIYLEDGRYAWTLEQADTPFGAEPIEGSLEAAYARIREAWGLYWEFCSSCGNKTTADDRRWLLAHADDVGVYCPECRGTACEPAGAFGYWPGEDQDPRQVALQARGDYIGPQEAAALMAEEAALRAFRSALVNALALGPEDDPAAFDAWVEVGMRAWDVAKGDPVALTALCEREGLDVEGFISVATCTGDDGCQESADRPDGIGAVTEETAR